MGVLTQFLLRRDDLTTYGAESTRKALPISTNIFRNSPHGYSRAIFCK